MRRNRRAFQLLNGFGHPSMASPPILPTASQCRTQDNRSSEMFVGHLTLLISENLDAGNYVDSLECYLGMNWQLNTPTATGGSPPYTALPTSSYHRINAGQRRFSGRLR